MDPFQSYRFPAGKSWPVRALSPCHAYEPPKEYFDLIIERAVKYGYNQIHVANHQVEDDLEQFCHYEAFPGLEAKAGRDPEQVERRIALWTDFTRKAKEQGIETYVWHHELNFPAALAELHPDGFFTDKIHSFPGDKKLPTPNLDSPVIWDFIEKRFEEAYSKLPDLTGMILTIQESDIPIYHLAQTQEERARITRRLYDHIHAIHQRLGRKWVLRTFAWREWEYAAVFDALDGFDPELPVEMKAVPMDWQIFYPHNRLISALKDRKKNIEMDLGVQFWGECEVPAVNVRRHAEQIRYADQYGCTGAVVRTDRVGGHTFDKPMEVQIAVVGEVLRDLNTDIVEAETAWYGETYGAGVAEKVTKLMSLCWEVVTRTYFVDRSWFMHRRACDVVRGLCNTFVAERDLLLEPGDLTFRREADLARTYLEQAEALLAEILAESAVEAPAEMPNDLHNHIAPAPAPHAELARQIRNLRVRFDYFSAVHELIYAIRCNVYDRRDAAREEAQRRLADVKEALGRARWLSKDPEKQLEDWAYVVEKMAPRKILQGKHFSDGKGFHGRSYAVPFPEPLTATLPAATDGGQTILTIFCGTHMCREVVLDVTINGQIFEVRRGTMSWFWAYDGYKRAEVEVPAELCSSGALEVSIRARDWSEAPFVPEIRTEVEYEGYKPRKDT